MHAFEFLEPESLEQASALVAEHGESGRLVAGGTALLLMMRQRLIRPQTLISLGRVGRLKYIDVKGDGSVRIGALTTHAEIETHAGLREKHRVIADMARYVADRQIRNVGTIGGNLCHGDPASDPPACLLALGARVRAVRGSQERVIPLDAFFTDYYENALAAGEIVTEIEIPPMAANVVTRYRRFTVTPAERRPLVGLGVAAALGRDGTCEDVRIAVGAVTAVPLRLADAERTLRGQRVTAGLIAEAAERGVAGLRVQSDFRASADYRKHVTRVLVRQTLGEVLQPASNAHGKGRS
jgi:aerobic carbon-monoxide dehydrogenase medium subunit